jgi:Leucine-rich repeat (LRR) protein
MDIWALPRLRVLNLRDNAIKKLDDAIERVGTTLEELLVDDNQLSTLPECLAKFRSLTKLRCPLHLPTPRCPVPRCV